MFTGIIEGLAKIVRIEEQGANRTFYLESDLAGELQVDQSICHNGICLTVEGIEGPTYRVTAIRETLLKTSAGGWRVGDTVNLERSLRMGSRLDGHLVQGHVDGTAVCEARADREGSVEFTFRYDDRFAPLLIEKGSVCLNGVSLTAFNVSNHTFTVAIIPYTYHHTTFRDLRPGNPVNIEFDLLGKYVQRMMAINEKAS